jgi:hypothetical protein
MTTATSTNTLGFILWTVALAIVGWAATVAEQWWQLRRKKDATPLRRAVTDSFWPGVFLAIGISGLVLVAWVGFVVWTVYSDHQSLVAQTKEIPRLREELNTANAKLLTTPYRGDRHITGEQENALYQALRDVAVGTPANRRIIYLGYVDGDQESRRFVQLFLWNNVVKAGWKVNAFTRNVRHKDSDLHLPGLNSADVSVTSTLLYTEVQKSPAWKEQEQQITELLAAIRVLEQENMATNQGLLVDENDPLRNKKGFIIWVNPKQDGPK